MSFPLVHFKVKLQLKSKKGINFSIINDNIAPNNALMSITYPFEKSTEPQFTHIVINGITRNHAKLFTKNSTVSVIAGWSNSDYTNNDYMTLFTEKIYQDAEINDDNGNIQMSFDCISSSPVSNETSLSKIKAQRSANVRNNASNDSYGDIRERKILNQIRYKFGIKSKHIRNIKQELASKEKHLKNKLMVEYPEIHDDKSHKKGNKTKYNHEIIKKREYIRKQITNKFNDIRKSLGVKSKLNHRQRTSKEKRVRTQYGSYRKRVSRARSKRKSKSVKYKNGKHYKKGTRAKFIIKDLAKYAHINLGTLNLIVNKRYTSGYTADKKPWNCIIDVVNDCHSDMWWSHGKLQIGDFANGKESSFVLDSNTGLLSAPSLDNDDDSDSKINKYQIQSILRPCYTSGFIFRVIDPIDNLYDYANNAEPVTKGEIFDDVVIIVDGEIDIEPNEAPIATLDVVKKQDKLKAENMDLKKDNRTKAVKDKKFRNKIHLKRRARQIRRGHHKK